jgi:isopenicillin N synthase-like dioxygenase
MPHLRSSIDSSSSKLYKAPTMSLPIIDITPFLHPSSAESKRAAAAALNEACTTHGFFYLASHGIPSSLEARCLDLAHRFFSLPPGEKSAIQRLDPPVGDGARGYQGLGENVTAGASDQHEAIDFYRPVMPEALLLRGENLWPQTPGFRETFEEFWDRLQRLGEAMMRAMAWALGYEEDEEMLLRWTREAFWVARVIGYPPLRGEGVSCGIHTGLSRPPACEEA